MKIKTSELIGMQLDWAVGRLIIPVVCGPIIKSGEVFYSELTPDNFIKWCPSTNWSQGGPLIERFGIMLVNPESDGGDWEAFLHPEWQDGGTPLIAACRAIVMDKLGEEVEVPDELA